MISNSTFQQNSAGDGTYDPTAASVVGGIAVISSNRQSSGSTLYMADCTFDNNISGATGALHLEILQCIALFNNTLSRNQGSLGAVYILQTSGDPTYCAQQARNNVFAAQLTAHINNPFVEVYNMDLRSNNFSSNEWALYLDTLQQPVLLSASSFEGNQAVVEPGTGGAGAGLYMIGSFFAYITVTDCLFTQNSSPFLGGAIFVLSFSIQHTVRNCTIDNNQAAVSGGGIAMVDGSLSVNNSTLVSNDAGSEGGGGVTCRDCLRLSVVNTSLINNTCQEVGGGIKVSGLPASDIIMDQVTARGNT